MKRSEMLEHIQAELEDLLKQQAGVSIKRYPHWIKAKAADILDMCEGFGMEPPFNESKSLEAQTHVNMWDVEDKDNPWRPFENK